MSTFPVRHGSEHFDNPGARAWAESTQPPPEIGPDQMFAIIQIPERTVLPMERDQPSRGSPTPPLSAGIRSCFPYSG